MKKLLLVLGLVLFVTSCFSGCFFSSKIRTDNNIEHYLNSGGKIDVFATAVLPSLKALPEYENIYYQYYINDIYFGTETMILEVAYDSQTYEAEKKRLGEIYSFLNCVVIDDDHSKYYLIPEYEFSINTYNFRVVEDDGSDDTQYPKRFGLIATSDEKNSIAYLYFYGKEYDYISEKGDDHPMRDFIEREFKHQW